MVQELSDLLTPKYNLETKQTKLVGETYSYDAQGKLVRIVEEVEKRLGVGKVVA